MACCCVSAPCTPANSCVCHCTANGGVVPRFLNASLNFNWARNSGGTGSFSVSESVTLTRAGIDDVSEGSRRSCWTYVSPGTIDTVGYLLNFRCYLVSGFAGQKFETITLEWFTKNLACPVRFTPVGRDSFGANGNFESIRPAGDGTALCFGSHTGESHSDTFDWTNVQTESCGVWTGQLHVGLTINGFAA